MEYLAKGKLSRRHFLAGTAATGIVTAFGCGQQNQIRNNVANQISGLPEVEGWKITRWEQDPWSRGSYSYIPAGSSSILRIQLAEPTDGRRFMAGEATQSDFPATVNGAVKSGKRAASEVLQARRVESCIVVGAGAAGLAAAAQLNQSGCDVTVLEGRDRIGGRAWTEDLQGSPVDLGASWFHGVNTHTLTPRAKELGIELIPTDYENGILFDSSGNRFDWSRLDKFYDFIYGSIIGKASKESMGPLIENYRESLSMKDRNWFDYVVVSEIEHEFAAHVEDLSLLATSEGASPIGGDAVPRSGYAPFMEDLAKDLDIRLSTKVSEISHDDIGAKVITDKGIFTGDAVVVTLPLGVLQSGSVQFRPSLSVKQQAAINGLGMGLLNKIAIKFKEPFWDISMDLIGRIPDNRGYFVEWYNAIPWTGEPILVGYNAARSASEIEAWSDAETLQAALNILKTMQF